MAAQLPQLFGRLLRPIGVTEPPADIGAAIDAFISRRDELERDHGITVTREPEEEVRAGIRRLGLASQRTAHVRGTLPIHRSLSRHGAEADPARPPRWR